MTRIVKSIDIHAPVEQVFAFVSDGRNTPRYYDSLHEWKPIGAQYKGKGATFAYQVKGPGMTIDIMTKITDIVENQAQTFESIQGPKVKAQWTFEPHASRTRVRYILEYEPPVPILGHLLDVLVIRRKREADTERMLENLKQLLES